jgi:spore coat protein H
MALRFRIEEYTRIIGRRFIVFGAAMLCALTFWGSSTPGSPAGTDNPSAQGKTSGRLLIENKIWNVELEFEKEQYAAMEPKLVMDSGMGDVPHFLGMPDMPDAFGEFRLGNIVAPAIFKEGNSNHDSRMLKQEFVNMVGMRFQKWDIAHAGQLEAAVIKKDVSGFLIKSALSPAGPEGMFVNQQYQSEGKDQKKGVGFLDMDFPYVKANLVFDGGRIPQVSVRYKGNSTYMEADTLFKRSLKVDLSNSFQGRKLYEVSKLNFHNAIMDGSWMNEVLSYRLHRDAGVPAGRTSYARVYVTVPGMFNHKYFGLYIMVEDVDKDFAKAHYDTKQGALFKPLTRQLFEDAGDSWKAYTQIYNPKTETTEGEKKRLIEFCKLISHASDAELAATIGKYLDIDEVARYLAVTVWLGDWDSLLLTGQNLIIYLHPKTNLFHLLPWDLDLTFGHLGHFARMGINPEQLSIMHPWSGRKLFLERLFKLDEFRRIYLARMKEFSKTIFRVERIQKQVDELAAILRPAVKEESEEKLAMFDQLAAGTSDGFGDIGRDAGSDGFRGTPFQGAKEGPQNAVGLMNRGRMGPVGKSKPIKVFATARALSVESQLDGKSEGEQFRDRGGMFGQ